MRAKPFFTASLSLALSLAAAQAGAFNITHTGPVKIEFGGYTTRLNSGYGSGTFLPNNVSASETTWGVGRVLAIIDSSTDDILWSQNSETIWYMLYGIADANIQHVDSNIFYVYNQGCLGGPCDGKIHFDFYLNPTGIDFSTTLTSQRSGFNGFTGVTDSGTLLMRWELVPGIVNSQDDSGTQTNLGYDQVANTTLFQNMTSATLPVTGDGGTFYANCVSGIACPSFDTKGFLTSLNTLTDFSGIFTLGKAADAPLSQGWQARIDDPVFANMVSKPANMVPEPASFALMGAGLLGFITLRRRVYGAA